MLTAIKPKPSINLRPKVRPLPRALVCQKCGRPIDECEGHRYKSRVQHTKRPRP